MDSTSEEATLEQFDADVLNERMIIPGSTSCVAGSGVLRRVPHWLAKTLQKRPKSTLIFSGPRAWKAAGSTVAEALANCDTLVHTDHFPGECSEAVIDRYVELISEHDVEVVVGAGGGKVLDTAKAAASRAGVASVTIPTIASNCAAWTPLSVIYDDDGRRTHTEFFPQPPLLTVLDYDVIAKAPEKYLLSGIGDTVVKWYEARLSSQNVTSSAFIRSGLALARLTKDELFNVGARAVAAVRSSQADAHLADTVDTIIALGGLVGGIGGEATRVAVAHAIYNGWTQVIPGTSASHGELAAFGLLVQLIVENRPADEIKELHSYYDSIGLPTTLQDLGIEQDKKQQAAAVAEKTAAEEFLTRLDLDVEAEAVQAAVLRVDAGELA